jgi:hypothetical protein
VPPNRTSLNVEIKWKTSTPPLTAAFHATSGTRWLRKQLIRHVLENGQVHRQGLTAAPARTPALVHTGSVLLWVTPDCRVAETVEEERLITPWGSRSSRTLHLCDREVTYGVPNSDAPTVVARCDRTTQSGAVARFDEKKVSPFACFKAARWKVASTSP